MWERGGGGGGAQHGSCKNHHTWSKCAPACCKSIHGFQDQGAEAYLQNIRAFLYLALWIPPAATIYRLFEHIHYTVMMYTMPVQGLKVPHLGALRPDWMGFAPASATIYPPGSAIPDTASLKLQSVQTTFDSCSAVWTQIADLLSTPMGVRQQTSLPSNKPQSSSSLSPQYLSSPSSPSGSSSRAMSSAACLMSCKCIDKDQSDGHAHRECSSCQAAEHPRATPMLAASSATQWEA